MSGHLVGDMARWMGVCAGRKAESSCRSTRQPGRHLPYLCTTAVLGVCGPAKICTFGYLHPGTWHLCVRPARRRLVGGKEGGGGGEKGKNRPQMGQQERTKKNIWACLVWPGGLGREARNVLARCRWTAEVEKCAAGGM